LFLSPAQAQEGWMRGGQLAWDANRQITNTVLRYHALVIGINEYHRPVEGEGWEPLTYAADDARAMAGILANQYGFRVKSLLNGEATRRAILAELDKLCSLGLEDAVLIYFAGHGQYDQERDEGYWIPVDARKKSRGRMTAEDWVWNSSLLKLFGASRARHVLVIADACFSGALFRGESAVDPDKVRWYQRAIAVPSRYLITSGNVEAVLDRSGFAQSVQNYLRYAKEDVFAASDLAEQIKRDISRRSNQLVRTGPLQVPTHAGGEFVFVRPGTRLPPPRLEPIKLALAPPPPVNRGQALREAAQLAEQGLPQAARAIAEGLRPDPAGEPPEPALTALLRHLDRLDLPAAENPVQRLLSRLEDHRARAPRDPALAEGARLRVVALHPGPPTEEGAGALALLCLEEALLERPALQVVDRAHLEQTLTELDLAHAPISDPRAALELGKFLPAGLLLVPRAFPLPNGGLRLAVRVVDCETSRTLASFSEEVAADADPMPVCRRLAQEIERRCQTHRPLNARVWEDSTPDRLRAGLGSFHGVAADARFDIVRRTAPDGRAVVLGQARVDTLGAEDSAFTPAWASAAPESWADLWLTEVTRASVPTSAPPAAVRGD
jgi:hypothetical protein